MPPSTANNNNYQNPSLVHHPTAAGSRLSFTSYSTWSTNMTGSDLVGPGRILGNLYSRAGRALERRLQHSGSGPVTSLCGLKSATVWTAGSWRGYGLAFCSLEPDELPVLRQCEILLRNAQWVLPSSNFNRMLILNWRSSLQSIALKIPWCNSRPSNTSWKPSPATQHSGVFSGLVAARETKRITSRWTSQSARGGVQIPASSRHLRHHLTTPNGSCITDSLSSA